MKDVSSRRPQQPLTQRAPKVVVRPAPNKKVAIPISAAPPVRRSTRLAQIFGCFSTQAVTPPAAAGAPIRRRIDIEVYLQRLAFGTLWGGPAELTVWGNRYRAQIHTYLGRSDAKRIVDITPTQTITGDSDGTTTLHMLCVDRAHWMLLLPTIGNGSWDTLDPAVRNRLTHTGQTYGDKTVVDVPGRDAADAGDCWAWCLKVGLGLTGSIRQIRQQTAYMLRLECQNNEVMRDALATPFA